MAESYRAVVDRLASAQKSSKGAPPYSRFVNRPFGRRIAAVAYLWGWTPNQVTAVSASCSALAIGLVAFAPVIWPVAIAIGTLFMVGYAFDAADGQLARLRGGGSAAGEWLDHVVDAIKTVTLHQAILVALWRGYPIDQKWQFVVALHTIVAVVSFFAQLLNDALRRERSAKNPQLTPATPQSSSVLRSLVAAPTDYGVLCVLFLLWAWPIGFFSGYLVMTAGSAGYLLLALFKWYSDMRRLDQVGAKL